MDPRLTEQHVKFGVLLNMGASLGATPEAVFDLTIEQPPNPLCPLMYLGAPSRYSVGDLIENDYQ